MRDFEGRTAVVTGAASGIGRALVDAFCAAGMNVVLADVEEKALAGAVVELEGQGHTVRGVGVDTRSRESVAALAEQAVDAFGKVHILVNNAGVASMGEGAAVWEIKDEDWEWVMGVNFYGVLYGLQCFVPAMIEHGEEGHIVNTASLAGLLPGGGPYSVSKHGVLTLTEGLSRNLKERGGKIGASVLCPGFVQTQIFDAERNRPKELEAEAAEPENPMARALGEAMVSGGIPPADVADEVMRAIQAGDLYILPHPAWDPIIKGRVEAVIDRHDVVAIDFEDMMRRRAAGEKF